MNEIKVPILVNLHPEQLRKLLVVRQFICPDESWDKTIGDAIDIALDRYKMLLLLSGETDAVH